MSGIIHLHQTHLTVLRRHDQGMVLVPRRPLWEAMGSLVRRAFTGPRIPLRP